MCVIELNVIETNTLINLQDNFKFYKNIWNIVAIKKFDINQRRNKFYTSREIERGGISWLEQELL